MQILESLRDILELQNIATIENDIIIYPLTHLYQENGPGKTDIVDIERQAHISTGYHSSIQNNESYQLTIGYLFYMNPGNSQFIEQETKFFDTLTELQKEINTLYCSY